MLVMSFLSLLLILPLPSYASGNGSSGVGNGKIIISRFVSASDLDARVKRDGDFLFSLESGKKILVISNFAPESEMAEFLMPSRLGEVQGFEFIPPISGNTGNYWIVCGQKGEECKKLTPLGEGSLAAAVMGTLQWEAAE